MAVNNAARYYIGHVAWLYDHWQGKNQSPLLPHEELDLLPDDPLVLKTREYNQCKKMADWYAKTDPLSPLKEIYVDGEIDEEKISERLIESKAAQYSAYCRLTEAGEELERIIPLRLGKAVIETSNAPSELDEESDDDILEKSEKHQQWLTDSLWKNLPPFFNIISPKSQLDNRVFEKAYCGATEGQRAELIRLMNEACTDLKIESKDLDRDRMIYKIQGIAAAVFESPLTKVIFLIGFTYVVVISYSAIVLRIINCFLVVIIPQCAALIDLRAPLQVSQAYHTLFKTAVAVNTFLTTPDTIHWVANLAVGRCKAYAMDFTKPVVPILSTGIKICYYIVLPRVLILSYTRPYIYRALLIVHKILSGVEHRTIWTIQEKFGKDSDACKQGLKAHALFLRIMQKGTPEDALMLKGWLPKPSLSA